MPKIIEMKKDDFLKKIKGYAANKKEKPTKLSITPDALAALKVKFVFAKTDEVTLNPQDLSFFKKSLMGRATPAKITDADASKTYYFSFCAPLLKELATTRIYVGRNAGERLEALATYLDRVKDGKVIFAVIPKTSLAIDQEGEEKEASLMGEENVSCSESFLEAASVEETKSVGDAHAKDTHVEDLGPGLGAREEGNAPIQNAFQELFEESRRRIEDQEFTIQGLEQRVQAYEALVRQHEVKVRETKIKAKENRLKAERSGLKVENLTQALHDLELENAQLRALQVEGVRDARVEDTRVGAPQANQNVVAEQVEGRANNDEAGEEGEGGNEDEEFEYGNEINELIAGLDDEEAEASLHLTEAITQWNNRLHWWRGKEVNTQVYNWDQNRDEEQTLARFIALAKLEKEKAAHFANHDSPWPKEEALATLQESANASDLECFALYQGFPEELKKFAILFAFWEMAHHNRFYRNALETVLNGGNTPATLGMADHSNPTDVMLKLLHYADLTRILMGHYHYLARHQFDIDLFMSQAENKARYGNLEGKSVDISRATIEAKFYQ